MHRAFLLSVLFSSAFAQAQVSMPATTRVGLAELSKIATTHPDPAKLTAATEGYFPTALIHGRCMVGFLGKTGAAFNAEALQEAGVSVGARVGDIVSFRVDAQALELIQELPGLTYLELAGKAAPQLNRVAYATRADSVHRGIDLPQSYTGRDVLIGITDWGFDYRHPTFYDTAMTDYRIRAAWDQYRQAGPAPAGMPYGTELTTPEALIAMGADTANIYSYATHGTHVAGIAGGGGAGTPYRGMAFDARFLFCTFLVDAAAVLDAFAWMRTIAEQDDKRLVINMSWGLYHIGTLDGNSLISQAIDQLSEEGVVFVNSGGNNGDVDFHLRKDFTGDTLRTRLQFYPYSAHPRMWGQSISMWGEEGAPFQAGFVVLNSLNETVGTTPFYSTATQGPYLDSSMVIGNDTVFFNLTTEAAHPLNQRPHFRLRVKNRNTALRVIMVSTAPAGRVHYWNVTELTNDVGNWGQAFVGGTGLTAGNNQYGISEPACTNSIISVAAFSPEFLVGGNTGGGAVAGFSSIGPTLDERVKPDIAAPGVSIGSSMSSFTDAEFTSIYDVPFAGGTYPFARLSGTSMSAPAVAGIVALVLESDPTLSTADVKDVLMATARTDNFTGIIPEGGSTRWGAGKVNAYHAVRQVLGLTTVQERMSEQLRVWPNPATDRLNIMLERSAGPTRIDVVDVTGRTVSTVFQGSGGPITVDLQAISSGVYHVRVEQDVQRYTAVFVKQ